MHMAKHTLDLGQSLMSAPSAFQPHQAILSWLEGNQQQNIDEYSKHWTAVAVDFKPDGHYL